MDKIRIPDECTVGTQCFDIFRIGFLTHAYKDFRLFNTGEKNLFRADDYLTGACSATRFRPVILSHSGMFVIKESRGFPQNISGQDYSPVSYTHLTLPTN